MKSYTNGDKQYIYDPCRQRLLLQTPEEEIRQRTIQILIEEMQIPRDAISTEFPLHQIDSTSKKRADIVVWCRSRNEEIPLLVLEIKASHIKLTNHTLEQVQSYNRILKAKYIGISNGDTIELFVEHNERLIPLTNNLYTYVELIKGEVIYSEFRKLNRLSYDLVTYNRYIDHLVYLGYIGEDSLVNLLPFISELQNYILCGELQPSQQYNSVIADDLSYGIFSFGNASGGEPYAGYYRSLLIKDLNSQYSIYRIGIFGTLTLSNDPVYGNRNGGTYLMVAVDDNDSGTSTNVLQLRLDKFLSYSKKKQTYDIFHNGRRNGFKNVEVLDLVNQYSPHLLEGNQVYLGSLPAHSSMIVLLVHPL